MNLATRLRRFALGTALAAGLLSGVTAADAAEKYKIFLSMSYIGNDWQAEAANMVKAMAAHKSMADKVDLQVQVAGPECPAPDPADQRHGAGGRRRDRDLPDLADGAQPGRQERLRQGCAWSSPTTREITEPCAYNISIDQEEAGRVTAEWLVDEARRQGQHRRADRRARHLGRHTAHQGAPRRSSPSTPTSRSSPKALACGARR